jgi:predicted phage terminase large subunit-like protein
MTTLLDPSNAAKELLRRRAMRRDFLSWCEFVLAPQGLTPAAHHRLIIRELQAVADGRTKRLMMFLPPGSAKSTYTSLLFPAWLMARQPGLPIIAASHTAALAENFSRRVQNLVREHSTRLGFGLASESAELWTSTNGGQYRAAGVGGAVTGFRAGAAICDDLVKSRADAESPTYRERAWEWFNADLKTRLKPGSPIVLIGTRWHADDIYGRLLEVDPEAWRVLKIPAMASEEDDPLGREIGQPLWGDDDYGYGAALVRAHADYQRAGAMRDWSSLYQQDPRPSEGALFKIERIEIIDAAPAGGSIVRAWDLAATKQVGTRDPDWTVGVKLQRTNQGGFTILDVVRLRGGPDEVEAAIVATASQDGRAVAIGLPQDPGQAGKAQAQYLTRRLAGYTVKVTLETGDKATRAAPVASQVNVGNVRMLKGFWNRPFLDELAGFPSAAHDDQADALSRAFGMVGEASVVERFRALSA